MSLFNLVSHESFNKILNDENKNTPPLNIFRMIANLPQCINSWLNLISGLYATSVPAYYREIAILKQAAIINSEYEIHQHVQLALTAGLSEELIAKLIHDNNNYTLSASELNVCKLATEIEQGGKIEFSTLKALQEHFNDQIILELIIITSFYSCVGRVVNATEINIENINYLKSLATPTVASK